MKRERLATVAIAGCIASLLALGAVGSMVTGFSLTLERGTLVVGGCVLAAFGAAFALQWRGGSLGLLLLAGGIAWRLWRQGEAADQFLQLLTRMSHLYAMAYGWDALQLTALPWDAGAADLPMLILGGCIAAVTAWTVTRGESALFALPLPLLLLFSCLVVTDTVPAPACLFAVCLGMLVLLLTSRVRSFSQSQGNRLTLMIALPITLALLALFWAIPQEGYVNRSGEVRERILTWIETVPQDTENANQFLASITPNRAPDRLDLASLGPRNPSDTPVLDVTAEVGGTLYLRGQDYDGYDGFGWSATENRVENFGYDGLDLGQVTVQTRSRLGELYLPYYPSGGRSLVGGRLDNSQLYTEYTFHRTGLPELWRESIASGGDYPFVPETSSRYLALPEVTSSGAQALLASLSLGASATEKAETIGVYVRTSARYDLNPPSMPSGAADFALWFLEEADSGYCVHFATAAVVLLRAAGVEARYVTGYQVRAQQEQTVTATGENAHAWAEYYEPALGVWLVLDATPSAGNPQETPQPLQAVPETTAPTTALTEPPVPASPSESLPSTNEQTPAAPPSATPAWQLPQWLGKILIALAILVIAAGGLEGQRRLRLRLRRRQQTSGAPNARALALWREAEALWRCLDTPIPQDLEQLAQKAKFSQHTLTEQELRRMDTLLTTARIRLMKAPWYARLIHRYLYALY